MSELNCPLCGQEMVSEEIPEWLYERFPGLFGKIVRRLAKARTMNETVSMKGLIDAAYGDDPDGGPVHAAASISVTISRCRKDLQAVGWDIVGPKITRNGFALVKCVKQTDSG